MAQGSPEPVEQRDQGEILEEILDRVRRIESGNERNPAMAPLGAMVGSYNQEVNKGIRRALTLDGITVNQIEHGYKSGETTLSIHFVKDGRGGGSVIRYRPLQYIEAKTLALEVVRRVKANISRRQSDEVNLE